VSICPVLKGEADSALQSLSQLLSVLHVLRGEGYAQPECLPRYWESASVAEGLVQSELAEPYELSAVTMPPEMYDAHQDSREAGEGRTGSIAFFAEDVSAITCTIFALIGLQVVPSPTTLAGWTLRSLVLDIVHIFEVNRKECAGILLDLRRDLTAGTLKAANPSEDTPSSTLSLESLVISTLLSTMLALPQSPEPLIYYGSVITELCKLSPNTVAPPVGRAVRKLFSMFGRDGLDVEVAKRASEWFAVHLSNFGFQWMWKEWWAAPANLEFES